MDRRRRGALDTAREIDPESLIEVEEPDHAQLIDKLAAKSGVKEPEPNIRNKLARENYGRLLRSMSDSHRSAANKSKLMS